MGRQFECWKVIAPLAEYYWCCECKCGARHAVYQFDLLAGKSKQCVTCSHFRHGHKIGGKSSLTYTSWVCMMRRCSDVKFKDYERYGAAGIKVCEAWHTFVGFLRDMGERSKGQMLDRINCFGNYEKSNCRWVDAKTSARNRTNNRIVICGGTRMTLTEASERLGIKIETLWQYIKRTQFNGDLSQIRWIQWGKRRCLTSS